MRLRAEGFGLSETHEDSGTASERKSGRWPQVSYSSESNWDQWWGKHYYYDEFKKTRTVRSKKLTKSSSRLLPELSLIIRGISVRHNQCRVLLRRC